DGQEIKKGDLLISFDMEAIKNAGYKITTPMVVCNSDDYSAVEAVKFGSTSAGDILIQIK
ncbi:MAG: PTS glucose transporter subunit IIA, partial [Clostridia bacterium]|nr:PTS glucose transporter subunit IIA [Clostridia bacterium]